MLIRHEKYKMDSLKQNTALLIVDVQEKLLAGIKRKKKTEWNISRLIRGAEVYKIDSIFTLQNPDKLGGITNTIAYYGKRNIYNKTRFSVIGSTNLLAKLNQDNVQNIIICGVETHVCILQSVIDLLHIGFSVYLPVDAISSRNKVDHKIAIERMRLAGAVISTTESVLFEICQDSSNIEFRQISNLIKESI